MKFQATTKHSMDFSINFFWKRNNLIHRIWINLPIFIYVHIMNQWHQKSTKTLPSHSKSTAEPISVLIHTKYLSTYIAIDISSMSNPSTKYFGRFHPNTTNSTNHFLEMSPKQKHPCCRSIWTFQSHLPCHDHDAKHGFDHLELLPMDWQLW